MSEKTLMMQVDANQNKIGPSKLFKNFTLAVLLATT